MSFQNAGSPITARTTFNSGQIDFGTNRLVNVDNVKIDVSWNITDLFVLNSILPQDKVRSGTKVVMTGKIVSFAPEMEMLAMGSSTVGTPQEIDLLDGQPTMINPIVTLFDRYGKEIQYQLQNAIFKSTSVSSAKEAYGEWEFELEAKSIVLLYTV